MIKAILHLCRQSDTRLSVNRQKSDGFRHRRLAMRPIMGRDHLGDSVNQDLVFPKRVKDFPFDGREIAITFGAVGFRLIQRFGDRGAWLATEGVLDNPGNPGEIERQAKSENVVIAVLIAFPKVRRPADDHQTVRYDGKPDGVKQIERAASLAGDPRIVLTNLVNKPVQIDKIIPQCPDSLLDIAESRPATKVLSQPAKRPLVALLLAMIGPVHPEAGIGKPAIGKNRIQRAERLAGKHMIKALPQAWRVPVNLDEFIDIDRRRPSHAGNDIGQKPDLLKYGIVRDGADF